MKKIVLSIIGFFVLAHFGLAQSNQSEVKPDTEEQELLALAMKLSRPSLIYKSSVAPRMLEEVNFYNDGLKLPTHHPIDSSNAKIEVVAPWFSKIESTNSNLSKIERVKNATFSIAGNVQLTNFMFFFLKGRLWKVENLEKHLERFDLYPIWAKTPSLIDTNGAYQLATQWLGSISVDVPALERKHMLSFNQHFFYGKPEDLPKDQWTVNSQTTTNKTMLPIYDVQWGTGDMPPAKVTVLGTTKELLKLSVADGSLFKRPNLIVTNALELMENPDPATKELHRHTKD